ncbi:FAD-dependent oxidoreductase [Cryptosporangium sp. NPDC051539]|uniref:FAD-dependent oxidoreductase n=1 Tax=Cryptosporangium sp. NPDC051539 TaxID=3363962 RepID=UPI00379A4E6B
MTTTQYDVIVIGGGAAGLSGALTLGRARRSVLVVDAGRPRNAPADGVHAFLTRDGLPPARLAAIGRAEVESYGGTVVSGTVTDARPDGDGFTVRLADGTTLRAARLLVATGVTDEIPPVPGLAARWGKDLLHCPFCHGHEVRDRAIGVLSTGPFAVEQALLWRNWSERITLFLHTGPEPTDEQFEQLAARGVAVVDGEVTGVRVTGDRMTGVELGGARVAGVDAVVTATTMHVRLDGCENLGLEVADLLRDGTRIGTYVPADPTGKTAVPGVWVAGNVTAPALQVINAAAAGNLAGAMLTFDLVAAETARAVQTRRADAAPFSAAAERAAAERAAGHHHHGLGENASMSDELAETWNTRYNETASIWSGEPNSALVKEVTDLTPGRALDLGCGEGGDAVWLAGQGWTVTAVDISEVALGRAAAAAETHGVAGRITFLQRNLGLSFPEGQYDLVSAQFLHSWGDMPREEILRRAAAAVAPGGVLLIEGHSGAPHWQESDGSPAGDPHAAQHQHPGHELPGPDEVIAALRLPDGEWDLLVVDEHERVRTLPDGRVINHVDNTVKLRRRP